MNADFPEGYYHTCKVDVGELERWIPEVKNSFLNRLQYSRKNPEEVNHEPLAVVNGDKTNQIIKLKVRLNKKVKLNASGSSDPDKDKVSYRWFYYKEASTYTADISIKSPSSVIQEITLPKDIGDKNIHLVLEVKDNGSPALVAYRRVILSAK